MNLQDVPINFQTARVVMRRLKRKPTRRDSRFRSLHPPWLERRVPDGFWDVAANRRWYIRWLGAQLGYTKNEDWYQLTRKTIAKNHGSSLLQRYRGPLPISAIRECFPEHDWKEWLFAQLPLDFWMIRTNRQAYLKWLGQQLGIHRREEWLDVRCDDFIEHRGRGLLNARSGILPVLREYAPQLNWAQRNRHQTLRKSDILRWADAHFERTGCWPKVTSGAVDGMPGENWANINAAMKKGNRGLKGCESLAMFLAKHRGVRNHMRLPRLGYAKIRAWARQQRRQTGKWPNRNSGAVIGIPTENWQAILSALHQGHRGLPGGMTLAKLLLTR